MIDCFLGIMLAFTKRTPLQIAEAIVNLDCGLMTVELVQHFLQYLPNDAEVTHSSKMIVWLRRYGPFSPTSWKIADFRQNWLVFLSSSWGDRCVMVFIFSISRSLTLPVSCTMHRSIERQLSGKKNNEIHESYADHRERQSANVIRSVDIDWEPIA